MRMEDEGRGYNMTRSGGKGRRKMRMEDKGRGYKRTSDKVYTISAITNSAGRPFLLSGQHPVLAPTLRHQR